MNLKAYKSRVAGMGCIMVEAGFGFECAGRVELHHPREGVGAAQRESDWCVIPLCTEHHLGALGVHNRRSFYGRTKLNEWDLIALVIELNWRMS